MEIAPNIHAVQLLGANAFLITEPRLTLVDAGLAGSPAPRQDAQQPGVAGLGVAARRGHGMGTAPVER